MLGTKKNQAANDLLREALRRFECFAVRGDGKKWSLTDLCRA